MGGFSGGFVMAEYWWVVVVAILTAAAILWKWNPFRRRKRVARFAEVRRDFHRQRERLEAKFVQLGMGSARPDAARWTDCEFDDDVAYARNRTTGELSAFVAVTIELEDGDHPSTAADAVRSQRAATAVFRFDRDHWETDGRAIFNLTPTEAIRFYHRDLELLAQEVSE